MIINRIPVYNSWIALVIFITVLIFQPDRATFYAIRPSDVWLLLCFYLQITKGYNITIPFRKRLLIKNYGLFMGILAIIATVIQASYAKLSLDTSFIFYFYKFLRFLIIFKFAENILINFRLDDVKKILRVYTLIGIVILILSFLEFYNINPFRLIIIDLYYYNMNLIGAYIIKAERLAGVMGNENATAILLVSTLPYPMLKIGNEGDHLVKKILYIGYVLTVVYVLVVMTGSRTSIYTTLLILVFILIAALRRLKEVFSIVTILLLLVGIGVYVYNRYESEIFVQERITDAFIGENLNVSTNHTSVWSARIELWQDRFRAFNKEGNQLAILLGLGYTGAIDNYSDNGLISSFINNGITGLILKLILFYTFVVYGFFKAMRNYHRYEIDLSCLALALSAFALLMWESTADMIEHVKLGQLFYLFLSMVLIMNNND